MMTSNYDNNIFLDIESPTRRPQPPPQQQQQPSSSSSLKTRERNTCEHLEVSIMTTSSPTMTPTASSQRRQLPVRHPGTSRCCRLNIILYTCFFGLVFFWIVLQYMIVRSFRNTTSINLTSDNMMTRAGVVGGEQEKDHVLKLPPIINRWMDRIWNSHVGKLFFDNTSRAIPRMNSSSMYQQQIMEQDYTFIFMLLLGINVATLLPSWLRHISNSQTNNRMRNTIESNRPSSTMGARLADDDKKYARRHNRLLRTYLPAYLLATSADWLQGPYKYALYSSYGYSQRDIAQLFVAGYGSGMVLGSILGGLADSYGRKKLCLGYSIAYTLSILTKHCKYFYVLMLGRVFGGIATSLLYSCFESWLIGAHKKQRLCRQSELNEEEEGRWLAKSLSISMYGSSLAAIGSGILANWVVGISGKMRPMFISSALYIGGYISAFDLCLIPLTTSATLIAYYWEENYGYENSEQSKSDVPPSKKSTNNHALGDKGQILNKEHERGVFSALLYGIRTVWQSPSILLCCVVGSVFEGAMYVFIFLWTPTLSSLQFKFNDLDAVESMIKQTVKDPHSDSELPFGLIFATFMVSCMLGTTTFSSLMNIGVSASKCLAGILALSSFSCLAMARPLYISGPWITSSATSPQYIGMLLYEFCIGFYYPAMGTVKAAIIPENQRAAIYNVYRLPLNLFMLAYLFGDFSSEASFTANAIFLMVMCSLQLRFGVE